MSLSVALSSLSAAGFWPWLCDVSLKSAAALLAAACLGVCLRRASAAWQHLLWSATVGGLVLLPFASAALPRWSISLPASWLSNADNGEVSLLVAANAANETIGVLDAEFAPATNLAPLPSPPNASAPETLGRSALASAPTDAAWKLDVRSLLAAIWACGIIAALTPLAIGLASLQCLRRTSRVLADGPASAALRLLQAQCGLRRRIGLVESSSRAIPLTWGVLRPVIVLPADSRTWPAERLRAVLLHELAHISRCDWLTQLAAEVVRAIHWFNPLAWLAVHKLRVLQELACDDRVLGVGLAAADYAEQLLTVTSGRRIGRTLGAACLAMGRERRLESRLRAILDASRNRRTPSRRHAILSLAVALAALVSLASASFRLAAAEPAPSKSSAPAEPTAKEGNEAEPGKAAKGDEAAKEENAVKEAPAVEEAMLEDKLLELEDARRKILMHYRRKSVDGRTLTEGAIKGMLDALNDPYSQYLKPDEMRQIFSQIQSKLVGIGVKLGASPANADEVSHPVVITPLDESPALKAGVRAGDVILAVNGQTTKGLNLDEVARRIAGEEGTVVKLKIRRTDGEEVEVKVRRWPLTLHTVEGLRRDAHGGWDYWLDSEAKIGYSRLGPFSEKTVAELNDVLAELGRQSLNGFVLDLRWCPGGQLAPSVDVCKLFLSDGGIVSVRKQGEPEYTYKAEHTARFADLPLVVLVNEQTASAAEIVAGSLQDRGRAIVVGNRTLGKGSIQFIVPLGDEGAGIKLTSAYFVLPSGRNLDRHAGGDDWGVEPNDGFYVPLGVEQAERLLARRQDREILRIEKEAQARALERLTPQQIEKDFADPQLAAGLKTMLARLATGEFLKVGGSKHDAARLQQKELVLRQKRQIQRELERLQRELAELERADAAAEPATKP